MNKPEIDLDKIITKLQATRVGATPHLEAPVASGAMVVQEKGKGKLVIRPALGLVPVVVKPAGTNPKGSRRERRKRR